MILMKETAITKRQAEHIFLLAPAPPEAEDINDYIVSAIRRHDLTCFLYFLHHYEPRLNKRVYRFLMNEGIDRYDPERFLDYKLSCILALLECLPNYDPGKGADFLTYAHHFIGNALLDCRRQEEAGSFKSLDEYKAVRGIAWLYNNSGKREKEVIAGYAAEQNCSEETAAAFLTLAKQNRSRAPFCVTMQDEDGEETGEDVSCDDSYTLSPDPTIEEININAYNQVEIVRPTGTDFLYDNDAFASPEAALDIVKRKQGFLTKNGIAKMRSVLTNDIFEQELHGLYVKKDVAYKELTGTAQEVMQKLIDSMNNRVCANPVIEQKMMELSVALDSTAGKKQYGYLRKPLKEIVDTIVDELGNEPDVARCYDAWHIVRDEIAGFYDGRDKERPRLSQ